MPIVQTRLSMWSECMLVFLSYSTMISCIRMSLDANKHVCRVSEKLRIKQVSPATELENLNFTWSKFI